MRLTLRGLGGCGNNGVTCQVKNRSWSLAADQELAFFDLPRAENRRRLLLIRCRYCYRIAGGIDIDILVASQVARFRHLTYEARRLFFFKKKQTGNVRLCRVRGHGVVNTECAEFLP